MADRSLRSLSPVCGSLASSLGFVVYCLKDKLVASCFELSACRSMQIPPAGLSLIILYWFCFRLFLEFIYSLPLSPSLSLARSLSLSLSLFLCSILLPCCLEVCLSFSFLFLSLSFSFCISFSRVALRLASLFIALALCRQVRLRRWEMQGQ